MVGALHLYQKENQAQLTRTSILLSGQTFGEAAVELSDVNGAEVEAEVAPEPEPELAAKRGQWKCPLKSLGGIPNIPCCQFGFLEPWRVTGIMIA